MARTPDFRSLQAFVTVAKEGNVSVAANTLHITQPAVSLQLKRLAEDTGLTLFKRTSKGVELTADGALLLVRAERVLESLHEFSATAQRMCGKVRGKLRIGTVIDPSFIRLGHVLANLLESYPQLQTELAHGISGDIIHRLQLEQIDVGFYLDGVENSSKDKQHGSSIPNNLEFIQLTSFNYRVVAPADWKVELDNATWPELARLPWIGTPPDSVHNRLLGRIFKEHDCVQNVVAVVDQERSMMAMSHAGVGATILRTFHGQSSRPRSLICRNSGHPSRPPDCAGIF